MQRVVIAVLAVIVAVAVIVVIARESSDAKKEPAPPGSTSAPSASNAPPEAGAGEPDVEHLDDTELEVKELSFGDGSANQRSIRIEHSIAAMNTKMRDWLEPRESAAVSSRSAIDCHAQLARTSLVSLVCVTMPAGEVDADTALDASAAARYESLTLRLEGGDAKELSLQDILSADAGQPELAAACKKAATTPTPCVWPPTAFALGPEGALFLCHDSSCVTITGDPSLVKPELR